jgi:hypothetical protein
VEQIDAFICRAPKEQLNATLNIDLAFDAIEEALSFFADGAYSVERPPASDTWSDALIEFLRSESGENLVKRALYKNTRTTTRFFQKPFMYLREF